jgi:hypothetical protein
LYRIKYIKDDNEHLCNDEWCWSLLPPYEKRVLKDLSINDYQNYFNMNFIDFWMPLPKAIGNREDNQYGIELVSDEF